MKKIIFILTAIIFITIGGCQKKEKAVEGMQTNDVITELIKEDILSNSSNTNVFLNETNTITEAIPVESNKMKVAEETPKMESVPVEPEIGTVSTQKSTVKEDKNIKDTAIELPEKAKPAAKAKNTVPKTTVSSQQGSYVKIGNDKVGQTFSPRKYIKLTIAAFSSDPKAKYTDFSVYALPKGKDAKPSYRYQILAIKNVDIINGQAQLTKYWNGNNLDGVFLAAGNYNIYITYTVKDEDMNIIKKESRYWGSSTQYYIKLY